MIVRSPDPDVVIPDTPFAAYVLRQAERLAHKPALIDGVDGRTYTYGEVAAIVHRLAAGLSRRGFGKGDVLALFSTNCPEYPMVFLAVALLGGATTTINPTYTVDELVYQLNDAKARYLVAAPAVVEKALEGKRRSRVEEVFVLGEQLATSAAGGAQQSGGGSLVSRWLRRGQATQAKPTPSKPEAPTVPPTRGATPLAALLAYDGPVPPVAIDVAADVVALPYSSGTTGLAKGVMLTHRNLVANLSQMEPSGLVTEKDVVIGVLPFYHIYGLTVILAQSLANGATIVSLPRFDLPQFLQTLQDRRVTIGFVVPPIMLALAKQPLVDDYDLSHLRIAMSAAAPLAREVEETVARRLRCVVVQGWGLTETSPDVTLSAVEAARVRAGSVGRCIPNSECKVVDIATEAELGPNQEGEIWARGPQIMKGYLNNSAATAAILDGDGWLHTGDIGYVDEDGYFFIVDRLKELIKYKGYQVAPAELEGVLLTHPAVADAAVIPSRDEEAGEVPKAFVALKPGVLVAADELMAYVAERVAPYKRIRRLEFVDQIPKSASGKILRRLLVEQERAQEKVATAAGASSGAPGSDDPPSIGDAPSLAGPRDAPQPSQSPAPVLTAVAVPPLQPAATALETASRAQIAEHQLERLRAGLQRILASNRFYQAKLAGVELDRLASLDALRILPFTTKAELQSDQAAYPPYGTNLTYPLRDYIRLHQTSGTTGAPLRVLDTAESWDWWAECWTAVYRAAGVTDEDIVFLAFSFGPFIGFWSAYEGAKRCGALVVPGGGQSSAQRVRTLLDTNATVLVCTPTYALHLAAVAKEEGIDLRASAVRVTIHAGEPGASIPSTRNRIEEAWDASAYDHIGMTEVGGYAFTCLHHDAVHVNEAEFIAEILDPATDEPVAEGERGELVLTNLGRWGTPVIRYRTRDLVVRGPTHCACGRTFLTLPGGVLGRADDMLVVRGVNIYPSSIEAVLRRFPQIDEFRIVVRRAGALDEIEVEVECPEALAPEVESALRQALNLRVPVHVVQHGSLPRFELKARRVVDRRTEDE